MKKRLMALGAAVALLGLMIVPVLTASAASAAPLWNGGKTYICTGGNIPPGTYKSILVTGVCYTPKGTIVVRKNLTVAPGALLDAVTPGDPPGKHPVVPATVLIGGNVFVGKGAVLLFGCSPNISCSNPPGISFDRIRGNLTGVGAQAVVVHSASIGGNFSLIGGGGGAAAATCNFQKPGSPTVKNLEPWSLDPNLDFTPVYSDNEDSSVGGNITVVHLTSCWLGTLRNRVGGNVTSIGNTMGDPDAMEITNNLVSGNMTCLNNSPAVQYGDSGAAPNLVGGYGVGECGFNALKPNPAASPGPPPVPAGPAEHISIRLRSLNTYFGKHVATHVASLPSVTTTSGYTITAKLNDFTLKGNGLRGSGTVNLKLLPMPSGDAVLSTVYPNGSSSFIAYDTCTCSFHGKSGTVLLRFYGTTSPNGFTSGTFLVTSGGAANGKLAGLAGWGRFSSAGNWSKTWRLVEFLRIT
jgi:Protein of unknown function (DUF3224)